MRAGCACLLWQPAVFAEMNWLLDPGKYADPTLYKTGSGLPHLSDYSPLCHASFLAEGQARASRGKAQPAIGRGRPRPVAFLHSWAQIARAAQPHSPARASLGSHRCSSLPYAAGAALHAAARLGGQRHAARAGRDVPGARAGALRTALVTTSRHPSHTHACAHGHEHGHGRLRPSPSLQTRGQWC